MFTEWLQRKDEVARDQNYELAKPNQKFDPFERRMRDGSPEGHNAPYKSTHSNPYFDDKPTLLKRGFREVKPEYDPHEYDGLPNNWGDDDTEDLGTAFQDNEIFRKYFGVIEQIFKPEFQPSLVEYLEYPEITLVQFLDSVQKYGTKRTS